MGYPHPNAPGGLHSFPVGSPMRSRTMTILTRRPATHLSTKRLLRSSWISSGPKLPRLASCPHALAKCREGGRDSKLVALRECPERAEFDELKDGRGKLLVFTEHRDTLRHLREHLEPWGYSTCEIHGGMNPRERQEGSGGFSNGTTDLRRDGGGRGRHQPPVLPPDGQLRPALEPDPP